VNNRRHPTALVRDGSEKSRDVPPHESWTGVLIALDGWPRGDGQDPRRADDQEDKHNLSRVAFDVFDVVHPIH
jgi:hypothetical protein